MQPTTDDAASANAIPPIDGTSTYRPIEEDPDWRYNTFQVDNTPIRLACPSHVTTLCNDDILWTNTGSMNDIPLDLTRQNYLEKPFSFTLNPRAIHEAAMKSDPNTAGKRSTSQNTKNTVFTTSYLLDSHSGIRKRNPHSTSLDFSDSNPRMVKAEVKQSNMFSLCLPMRAEDNLKEVDILGMFDTINFTMEKALPDDSVLYTRESYKPWFAKDDYGRDIIAIPSEPDSVGSRRTTAKSLWVHNPLALTCNVDSELTKVSPSQDAEHARTLLRRITGKKWDTVCISRFEISTETSVDRLNMMGTFDFR